MFLGEGQEINMHYIYISIILTSFDLHGHLQKCREISYLRLGFNVENLSESRDLVSLFVLVSPSGG